MKNKKLSLPSFCCGTDFPPSGNSRLCFANSPASFWTLESLSVQCRWKTGLWQKTSAQRPSAWEHKKQTLLRRLKKMALRLSSHTTLHISPIFPPCLCMFKKIRICWLKLEDIKCIIFSPSISRSWSKCAKSTAVMFVVELPLVAWGTETQLWGHWGAEKKPEHYGEISGIKMNPLTVNILCA